MCGRTTAAGADLSGHYCIHFGSTLPVVRIP